MKKDNTKKLLVWIAIISLLLCLCISVDSADDTDTISNLNESSFPKNVPKDAIIVNNSSVVLLNNSGSVIVGKSSDKIYYKYPVIGMWAKPSVRSNYAYKWYYRTWINYCPNCHRYNSLLKNPKCVAEREYTCKYCDSDFCAVTGKEKYSWSKVYLRKA